MLKSLPQGTKSLECMEVMRSWQKIKILVSSESTNYANDFRPMNFNQLLINCWDILLNKQDSCFQVWCFQINTAFLKAAVTLDSLPLDVVYVGTIHPQHLSTGKLFMKSKKNVLIEKPLAMNSRETQELLSAAQENNVFLMEVTKYSRILAKPFFFFLPLIFFHASFQAIWMRFFPASVELRRLLKEGEVGDVQMVRAEFGLPVAHVQRMADRKLGGGGLVDLGIYPLQFALMVFNGERPESIHASGHCLDTGDCLKKVNLSAICSI